jgi:hypothetical protein
VIVPFELIFSSSTSSVIELKRLTMFTVSKAKTDQDKGWPYFKLGIKTDKNLVNIILINN